MNEHKCFSVVFSSITVFFIGAVGITGCSDPIKKGELNRTSVVCLKPDGKHYGLPVESKCLPRDIEVNERPDTGFLNTQAGKGLNYDEAKAQGDRKTAEAAKKKEALKEFKRLKDLAGHKWALDKIYKKYDRAWLDNSGVRDEIDKTETKEEANERKEWDQSIDDFWAKRGNNDAGKSEDSELSSASGIKEGAALAALEDLESTRAELVNKALRDGLTGPAVAAYLKDQMRPTIVSVITNAGGSSSDVEKAILYVNQGIDANLNP